MVVLLFAVKNVPSMDEAHREDLKPWILKYGAEDAVSKVASGGMGRHYRAWIVCHGVRLSDSFLPLEYVGFCGKRL